MKLTNLSEGTKVNFTAADKQGHKVEFESKVANISPILLDKLRKKMGTKDFCVVKGVSYKGKRVSVQSNNIVIDMETIVDDERSKFTAVSMPSFSIGDEDFNLVISSCSGQKCNKREAYRLPYSHHGNIEFENSNDNTANLNADEVVNIKDISAKGVGLIMDSSSTVKIGDILKLTFMDEAYSSAKKDFVYTKYILKIKVVRIIPIDDKNNLIGCELDKQYKEQINKFVINKQNEFNAKARNFNKR